MTKFYLATVAAVVVTTSLASNILMVGTRGSVRADLSRRMQSAARRRLRQFRHVVDTWVAAMIASRERQAAIHALHQLSDHELREIGLDRNGIGRLMRSRQRRSLQGSLWARR
jgi:uncharacterized protein YjiS (DUF1127 family)